MQIPFGPYILRRKLAQGNQGSIYTAYHESLGVVAIKILVDNHPEDIDRFKREAEVLASLNHPNLRQILDLGTVDGTPYLTTEYIKGRNLKTLYKLKGPPNIAWVIDAFKTLGDVVEYINGQGIIHQDIKPDNIVIEHGTKRIILIDFGICLITSLDTLLAITPTGTPGFMSPEQIDLSFGEIGPWTDVYGLGATLYYMLTGKPPFGERVFCGLGIKLCMMSPSILVI